LLFYEATLDPTAIPVAKEVANFAWRAKDEIHDAQFPPADIPVLQKISARLLSARL
jgi:hypothetical protein